MNLYKTTEKLVSENYPYGYTLRTTKYDYLEFDSRHGFRHCSYTINPKTGKENNPKKSTYSDLLVLGKDENNYTKALSFEFYSEESYNRMIEFLSNEDNFNLFTQEQKHYIYLRLLSWLKLDIKSKVVYCGSKFEDLKPLYEPTIKILVDVLNRGEFENCFSKLAIDWEKINSLKVEGYNPFKVTEYGIQ